MAVGFKAGCIQGPGRSLEQFYSWLGGVHPQARGQGAARRLMGEQHGWLREQGCRFVMTETLNRYRDMPLLNIRCGFDTVGTQAGRGGETKLILRKPLALPQ
ncbi:MAG: GNAT family N-acetyltransferase [Deinococcus sp.]